MLHKTKKSSVVFSISSCFGYSKMTRLAKSCKRYWQTNKALRLSLV